ncbi:MAG: glutamate synthase (NADPH), homotetrameric [Candidatus Fischerbacteria bacterium RBG_13_37_8]|uniref:Glutamate synthase (NADPH), homotetrameric n=1 Tax=Candidatus Fischerbacteria bacterium RBG_13_37_8 TaxID=1817863 RepID=A0A1F5V638_9BACT|nr:MAG: glutamate synthase (NADPH), homotetrameric [Candidatus Fischerbacteria bacterium RBG_13_37_8]
MAEKLKIVPKKTPMPEQPAKERVKNFEEVPFGYSEADAIVEAQRCLQCKKAPCIAGCPVEIDIPGFIKYIAEGDFVASIKKLKEKNVLPAVCGRVCPQETQCEIVCTLAKKWEPVAIGRLERFAADWEAKQGESPIPGSLPSTGKKVAIIGAGPGGLTVAGDLIKLGHGVTIYEALHKPGGVLVYGIPEFRLPKEIVYREVDYLVRSGVNLVLDFVVGKTATIEQLFEEYDAIYIGTGAGLPWFMNIPGENLNGVYSANEYLTRSNLMKAYLFPQYDTPIVRGKYVAVVGGGNVAMDCARTALRLGAAEVHIVYRRTKAEMPARMEEIHHAEEEGIIFDWLTLPIKYTGDERGWIKEMECIRMELGEPDASGRRKPVPIKDSNFISQVDVAVCAIGQSPNPLILQTTPDLKAGKWGNVEADSKTGKTSKKGCWAGGDVVRGGATVILAMGDARFAARSMQEYLETGVW